MILMTTIFSLLWFSTFAANTSTEVKNLMGEPDYRKVRLRWDLEQPPAEGFQVRYCELQAWGAQRCRLKNIGEDEGRVLKDEKIVLYETDIDGLRMATTYTFEVRPTKKEGREDRSEGGDDVNQNLIVIPTKGFSARATQCLPQASEIEVSTGPYFAGRIAVEATDGERCILDGEPNNPKDTYTLRINHAECGSQVNDTTVATFVIVQENLPILTHSTRRFLVLCSYQPETLTVRAGLSLPAHKPMGQGHASISQEENTQYSRRARKMRNGYLAKPEALVDGTHEEIFQEDTTNNALPITIITLLMVAAVAGLVAASFKWTLKKEQEELDNISVHSTVSVSSTSTTIEADSSECGSK
ncbi:uncharacterized protein [Onthophagus taurus]|uniref:uncharacterized protein n=1 Tax=Onthophagus taurus TaxID=166361 RepID=UPI000C20B360|nr:uncharacterized protein LOC111414040 [Onthophagus taurus]